MEGAFQTCRRRQETPSPPRHAISSRNALLSIHLFFNGSAVSRGHSRATEHSFATQLPTQQFTQQQAFLASTARSATSLLPICHFPEGVKEQQGSSQRSERQDIHKDPTGTLETMPSILLERDLAEVQGTFSNWDSCMTQAYCKWPAIVGIIIGCLIVLSIVWCCARCLCCGAECCCACCSCFNRCCPSPRNKNEGYQQPPAQPYGYGGQYQSHAPPMYGGGAAPWGGYRGPQTATFDVNSKKQGNANYNEDSLPAMPSWDTGKDRHELVEDDDVEMRHVNQQTAQSQPFLASGAQQGDHTSAGRYYNAQDAPPAGDLGTMQSNPYHDYDQHQQFVTSPTSTMGQQSNYPPTYHTYGSPPSTVYEPNYAPSIPPSYHTRGPASPPPGLTPGGIGRKPVQGSFRDV